MRRDVCNSINQLRAKDRALRRAQEALRSEPRRQGAAGDEFFDEEEIGLPLPWKGGDIRQLSDIRVFASRHGLQFTLCAGWRETRLEDLEGLMRSVRRDDLVRLLEGATSDALHKAVAMRIADTASYMLKAGGVHDVAVQMPECSLRAKAMAEAARTLLRPAGQLCRHPRGSICQRHGARTPRGGSPRSSLPLPVAARTTDAQNRYYDRLGAALFATLSVWPQRPRHLPLPLSQRHRSDRAGMRTPARCERGPKESRRLPGT